MLKEDAYHQDSFPHIDRSTAQEAFQIWKISHLVISNWLKLYQIDLFGRTRVEKAMCRPFVVLPLVGSILVCLSLMTSSPTGIALSVPTRKEQEDYLRRFAYMESSSANPPLSSQTSPEDMFRMALRTFQRMAGINETGEADAETKKMMEMPRCGVPDVVEMSPDLRRRRRFATQGSKWWKTSLTYRINNFTPNLSPETTASEIRAAFKVWSDESPLTFTEVTSKYDKVDINIQFARGRHGDQSHFDGPGGILAHAFYPRFGGDVHFDEDERWTSKSYSGTNLFQVAVHELGHSLGLSHSESRASIMAPFYRNYNLYTKLHRDDIAGIRYLYGSSKVHVAPKPHPTTPRQSVPLEICSDPSIDAIFAIDNDTYFFKGDSYYVLGAYGVLSGYPKKISVGWPGLPDNIDTAVYWKSDNFPENLSGFVYFFKDDEYWRYNKLRQPQGTNPQTISSRFPGLPRNLDAAFVWSGNGKLYFIKGDSYYRYQSGEAIGSDYPKGMAVWKGLPTKIDAAFRYTNNRTYFFSGNNYYRFNDAAFEVDSEFPRPTANWWLGCPEHSITSYKKGSTRVPKFQTFLFSKVTTVATTPQSESPDICTDSAIDAIFAVSNRIYVFKGHFYYVLGAQGILPGYPKRISDDWPGLPDNVDSAVYWPPERNRRSPPGLIYFFKDDKYWSYSILREPQGINPKRVSSRFWGLPSNIDVAFVWSGNGKLYFIKGDLYYRSGSGRGVDNGYPKNISTWKGLPKKVDAAFSYSNNRTYFFGGPNYYRFNDVNLEVDKGYPKSTAISWLGCPSQVRMYIKRIQPLHADEDELFLTANGVQFSTSTSLIGIAAILVSLLSC